jgi:dephospho-CoA kinase
MHIIKITGAQGAGKSEALGHLAELHQSTVITGAQLMAALPLLNSRTSALAGRDI